MNGRTSPYRTASLPPFSPTTLGLHRDFLDFDLLALGNHHFSNPILELHRGLLSIWHIMPLTSCHIGMVYDMILPISISSFSDCFAQRQVAISALGRYETHAAYEEKCERSSAEATRVSHTCSPFGFPFVLLATYSSSAKPGQSSCHPHHPGLPLVFMHRQSAILYPMACMNGPSLGGAR